MPHYPDEIEYSDKYMDDYYEYRHVILPRDVYKKSPRARLLTENVHLYHNPRNGDPWAFSSQEDGCIMNFIGHSLTFYYLEDQKEQILRQGYHLQDS